VLAVRKLVEAVPNQEPVTAVPARQSIDRGCFRIGGFLGEARRLVSPRGQQADSCLRLCGGVSLRICRGPKRVCREDIRE